MSQNTEIYFLNFINHAVDVFTWFENCIKILIFLCFNPKHVLTSLTAHSNHSYHTHITLTTLTSHLHHTYITLTSHSHHTHIHIITVCTYITGPWNLSRSETVGENFGTAIGPQATTTCLLVSE